jgi:hypothetical protein
MLSPPLSLSLPARACGVDDGHHSVTPFRALGDHRSTQDLAIVRLTMISRADIRLTATILTRPQQGCVPRHDRAEALLAQRLADA